MVDVPSKRFIYKWRRISERRQLPDVIAYKKLQKHPNPVLAAKQLREYVKKWEYDALAHYSLGVLILNVEKDPAAAIKCFMTVKALKPKLGNLYVDLTLAHLQMNNEKHSKESLDSSESAITLMSHAGESWNVRGAALGKNQRIYESIRAYKKSLFYDANQPMVHRNLGLMFNSLAQKRDAAAHYKKSLLLDPWCRDAYIKYSNVLVALGETEEAARVLQEMTKYFIFKQRKNPVNLPRNVEILRRIKEADEIMGKKK